MFNQNFIVKSPNSTCTHSSTSICNGHGDHHLNDYHDNFNSDATFEVDDSNNYNLRLTSVEHQYEAIKDDGPDLKDFSNGRPLQSHHGMLHTDQYRSRQLDYKKGMIPKR